MEQSHDSTGCKLGYKMKLLSNAFHRALNNALTESGLTGAQSFILGYLFHTKDSPPCQHDIETEFNITHPTVTGILKRLQEKGYVEFRPDEADRRLKRIVITPAGSAAAAATRDKLDETENRLSSCLDAQELAELNRILDKIIALALTEQDGAERRRRC